MAGDNEDYLRILRRFTFLLTNLIVAIVVKVENANIMTKEALPSPGANNGL